MTKSIKTNNKNISIAAKEPANIRYQWRVNDNEKSYENTEWVNELAIHATATKIREGVLFPLNDHRKETIAILCKSLSDMSLRVSQFIECFAGTPLRLALYEAIGESFNPFEGAI